MLVLTRKAGESIIIGDNIEITVIETKGDQIKLGIKAPKDVDIHRKEIYETIERIILLCIVDINVYRLPVLQKSTLPARVRVSGHGKCQNTLV